MEKLPIPGRGNSQQLSENLEALSRRKEIALKATAILLGCYRTGEANDPEVYISTVAAVLMRYPEAVVREATGIDGLPSKLKWLPTVSEVREECDRINERERGKEYRAAQLSEQFKLRKEVFG